MPTVWWTVIIVAAVIVGAAAALAACYNRLVSLRQRYLNAWSQIDVQLKRRHDLIPNLVETVKGYMAHERQTLNAVTAARSAAESAVATAATRPADAAAVQAVARAENALVDALGRLRVLSETYPQLKADRNAALLMEELTSTENRIAFARQAYNDAAMRYNTSRATFPTLIVAGAFGFGPATLFEVHDPAERRAADVSFGATGAAGAPV